MKKEDIKKAIEQDEKWDSGELGQEESYVERVEFDQAIEEAINQSARLRPISIRMEEELITDLKTIAEHHNLGYQPLIRQLLKRFVVSEKKILKQRAQAMEIKGPEDKRIEDNDEFADQVAKEA
ncbi:MULTISPECIES: hypothetical protein [Idiomarina]|jgi:predicted DNA binding CopG/RHH family protein|uniref:Uncharacterized protein n=1 Tax=Idiomarina abyssalis TaxID=86102 RepID=A0A8I1KGN9_9GAMM|nr:MULTISPECIES: hypothetical protein [Idiomarina]MAC34685.1 hypothetical protein [Haliea sp.]KPD20500.1 hypothetical protein ADS78_11740 [Idiomarina abyssalis]MAO68564.1 hypothetical protein [Idiomarina sp.]MBF81287.1 hypothetical protein [Idiomarina sp.]MBJ7265746.1 hypothetical protein [Idiomarina abyssalis]|tara:strand:+ start:1763 stop:2134 length:372 start_codon:yes stop_codon:yes gene_type:complete